MRNSFHSYLSEHNLNLLSWFLNTDKWVLLFGTHTDTRHHKPTVYRTLFTTTIVRDSPFFCGDNQAHWNDIYYSEHGGILYQEEWSKQALTVRKWISAQNKPPKHWRLIWNKYESKRQAVNCLYTGQGPSSHHGWWERIEKASQPCPTSRVQTLNTKTGETAWTGCFQAKWACNYQQDPRWLVLQWDV